MAFAGPGASIHYRSGRLGRTGQRHANALQKAMSSSVAGRKRGLVVVSCPFPVLLSILSLNRNSVTVCVDFSLLE